MGSKGSYGVGLWKDIRMEAVLLRPIVFLLLEMEKGFVFGKIVVVVQPLCIIFDILFLVHCGCL